MLYLEPAPPADPDDMSPYAPIHAWRALAQLRAAEAAADHPVPDWMRDDPSFIFPEIRAGEREGAKGPLAPATSPKHSPMKHFLDINKTDPTDLRAMIDRLTIEFNRTRQAVITNELIEIISGAEAL